MVQDIILNHKGSAKRYRLWQKSTGVTKSKIRKEGVYRKALHEYQSLNDLDNDWSISLAATALAFRSSVPAKKLKGYIQHTETIMALEISCFSQLQLECLNNTPDVDRVLHLDATGSLVKLSNNQDVLNKRVLNYICMVKNYKLVNQEASKFQLGKFILNFIRIELIEFILNAFEFSRIYIIKPRCYFNKCIFVAP